MNRAGHWIALTAARLSRRDRNDVLEYNRGQLTPAQHLRRVKDLNAHQHLVRAYVQADLIRQAECPALLRALHQANV